MSTPNALFDGIDSHPWLPFYDGVDPTLIDDVDGGASTYEYTRNTCMYTRNPCSGA